MADSNVARGAARGVGLGVVAFAAALVMLIWAAVIYFAERERAQAIDAVIRSNGQLARTFEEHTVRALGQVNRLLVLLRTQYQRQGSRFDLVQFYEQNQIDKELATSASIADETGRVVASSVPGFPPTSFADREHFTAHIARDTGTLHISKPVVRRIGEQRWTFVTSIRMNKPDGSFAGTVGIALDPAYFSNYYRENDLGKGGVINLIGMDGIIRARLTTGSEIAGQDIRGGEVFDNLQRSPSGSYVGVALVDGVRRIYSYRKLANYPLVINVGVAEAVALADYHSHRNANFVGAFLATLLIVGATATIYRSGRRQRRIADELGLAREQLLSAQHLAGIVSMEWDVTRDLVTWSRVPEFLLGPMPADGYPLFREMVHPEDRPRWLAERQSAIESDQARRLSDLRVIRTDGATRWISCTQRTAIEAATGVRRVTVTLLDITERKEAEFALAQSEQRLREAAQGLEEQVRERTNEIHERERLLRMVTENIPVAIGYYDAGLRLRFANARYAPILGVTDASQALGRHMSEFNSDEQMARHQPYLDRAMAGEAVSYEIVPMRDRSRWMQVLTVPQRATSGAVEGLFVVLIDITDRKRAEQELHSAVSLLTATLEATADAILVVRADRKILRANRRFFDMWGISQNLIDSGDDERFRELMAERVVDREAFIAQAAALYDNPLADEFDTLAFKDGRILERYSCPQLVDGQPVGRVWSFRDVTARLKAEASLRAADERYRSVVANMTEGVIVRDRNGRIIDCNASAERFTRHTLEQMRGETSVVKGWRVIREDGTDVPPQERSAMMALRTGKLQTDQVMGYCDPEGPIRWMSSTSQPLFDGLDATPSGVFTTITDVSARKLAEAERDRLEDQLRESQKMEAMGTLAGGIAHDFNNILAAILGNVALASDDVGANHPARESLEEIRKASERAKHLVLQILAFSRKQPQHFVDLPLQRVIEDTLGLLRATLPAGIEIDVSLEPAPLMVRADATQVGQVLMNLCTNAWHAVVQANARNVGASPGKISVSLDALELDAQSATRFGAASPGRYARLTVSDSGAGMEAETQARIFEPFFTTKPFGEGTGLGLAVVHGIVKAHGGAIAVSSRPGAGTSFEVILPAGVAPVAAPVPVSAPASGAAPGTRHVMYVDDEPAMVFLVTRMLKKLGYRVSAFERPEEAVAAVRADPGGFDVVVSDFNMPGLSGLDVAREVLQIRADLPVVIASGYITEELRAGAARLGVQHLIYKPNTVDELCQAIAQVLDPA